MESHDEDVVDIVCNLSSVSTSQSTCLKADMLCGLWNMTILVYSMTNASKSSWDTNNPQRKFSIGSPDLDFLVITDNLAETKLFQCKWKKRCFSS